MTWAQRYYGVNDYSTIDINSTGTAPTWNLKSKILDNGNQSGTFYRIGSGALNNNSNRLIVATDGSRVLFTDSNVNADWTGLSIDPEDIIELDVPGGAGGVELLVNGVSQGFKRVGNNVSISLSILGENNNVHLGADVEYFNFVTSDDGTLDRLYDATASIHAAGTPILSDISGNAQNATGVNMPTAGLVSAGGVWLDLGSSGPSGNAAFDIDPIEFSSAGSATLPQPIGNVSFDILPIEFSGNGGASLPFPEGSISFDVAAIEFSGAGSVTTPFPVGSISFDIQSVEFSGTGNATQPEPSGVISFDIEAIEFSGIGSATGALLPPGEVIVLQTESNVIILNTPTNLIKLY